METIVIRFRYENLRNEAHVELHETVKSLLEQLSPEQLGIATQCGEYRSLLDTEVAALDVIRRSERTLEIEEQDHRRDSIYRGLAEAVKSSLHHFDPAKQEAARRVEVIVEHYGNIAAKTLDQE
ncbi:MAG: DUF6261 family protein, partial [Prevotellaceae bacterium]|nr:DUF6261 family protein [Prevotellaceae bacterium]